MVTRDILQQELYNKPLNSVGAHEVKSRAKTLKEIQDQNREKAFRRIAEHELSKPLSLEEYDL